MSYTRQTWRLILSTAARGPWNMAVDDALLEATVENRSLPCLRLYAWDPACLSLGYAQPNADIDRARLSAHGWDWVRRPTGGRAILHTDELTYSVVAPLSEPRVTGSVLESYQRLSTALLNALHSLGLPAEAHPTSVSARGQPAAAVCFEVPSNYEIVVAGKKLVGSAQARRKNGVLQHGTLPLYGDLARITEVLVYPGEVERRTASARLLEHATTVEEVLGQRVPWETAAEAFIAGFRSELNLEFEGSELSIEEWERAEALVAEKYSHPDWLERI